MTKIMAGIEGMACSMCEAHMVEKAGYMPAGGMDEVHLTKTGRRLAEDIYGQQTRNFSEIVELKKGFGSGDTRQLSHVLQTELPAIP